VTGPGRGASDGRGPAGPDEGPWLVFGLGNPGPSYAGHRHTVGHRVVQLLAERQRDSLRAHKSGRADVLEGRFDLGGPRVVLATGRCYMNESGGPVAALTRYYGIDPARLVVVHDELDIPFETLRVKLGGGDNGHNGLRSVRSALGTGDFYRVRVGVGRPPGRQSPADFVLSDYGSAERKLLPLQLERAADAVESLVRDGLEPTQARYNS
jgi:PTH1 family peptidyl-tRNA hydrolase